MDVTRLSERTTVGVFLRQADRLGDRTVIRHHDGTGWQEVTWRQFADMALRVAAGLAGEGAQFGDRVALLSENRLEWLVCDLGIQLAGCVTVPIYASTPAAGAQAIAENAGVRIGIVADELASHLSLERIVRMDTELPAWFSAEQAPGLLAEVEERAARLCPDDLATLCYTSGTTGSPKGVMLAHRNFVDVAECCLRAFALSPDDHLLSFLPYAHVFERINGIFVGVMAGSSTWLSRGIPSLSQDLQECRPTVMVAVPRVYEKMHQFVQALARKAPPHRRLLLRWALAQGRRRAAGRPAPLYPLAERLVLGPIRERLTGGRLRFFVSGGASLSAEVEGFFWAVGVKILNGWGMTETSSGATSNTEHAHRFETVGRPLPGVEIRIAEDGEVLARSPGNMLGYYGNPQATAEVLDGEWVRTGDIGELDAEGFLRITDRKKELLKTAGGKYVAPAPMETRLMRDERIERAVVIGDERPYVTALIVPDWQALADVEGIQGNPEELVKDGRVRAAVQHGIDELNRGLGSWETVKYFELLPHDLTEEAGELTPSLKVKRRVVQERYRGLIDTMYQDRPRSAAAAS